MAGFGWWLFYGILPALNRDAFVFVVVFLVFWMCSFSVVSRQSSRASMGFTSSHTRINALLQHVDGCGYYRHLDACTHFAWQASKRSRKRETERDVCKQRSSIGTNVCSLIDVSSFFNSYCILLGMNCTKPIASGWRQNYQGFHCQSISRSLKRK